MQTHPPDTSTQDLRTELANFLRGYIGRDASRLEFNLQYPDWRGAASISLKMRAMALLDRLPDTYLHAIATGLVSLADTARGLAR